MVRVLAASVVLAVAAFARGADPAALERDLDALAGEARETWDVPGVAVAVVKGERVLLLKGYGVREQGRPGAVTGETIFSCGSLTKAVAATALAKLAEDGKVRWDDPVRRHVPYFRLKDELADRDVTLRDLLCHRTGLGRHDLLWRFAPWGLEESVRRVAHLEPEVSFRSGFVYNNLAYITLGFAITSAAKKPWHEYVRDELFRPLGMKVVFTRAETLRTPDHAVPHRRPGEKNVAIELYDDDNQIRGSGSMKASAADLARWARFHLDEGTWEGKQIVGRETLRETYRPQVVTTSLPLVAREADTTQSAYGLGWHARDHRGRLVREHGGSVEGFRAHIILAPAEKVGVVVLCNLHNSSLPIALSYALLDRTLGLPGKDWNGLWKGVEERSRRRRGGTRRRGASGGTRGRSRRARRRRTPASTRTRPTAPPPFARPTAS
jgi:CubicO group peptidase (beta-lactamase class C family)